MYYQRLYGHLYALMPSISHAALPSLLAAQILVIYLEYWLSYALSSVDDGCRDTAFQKPNAPSPAANFGE